MIQEKISNNCIKFNKNNEVQKDSLIKPFAFYIEVYEHGIKNGGYIMQTKEYKSEKALINRYNSLIMFTNAVDYDFYLMGLCGSISNYDIKCIRKLEFN